ncbi:MAG TPA: hypothetical protein DCE41_18140 [Cytophagales bacterium]|nr:hypothetical protein [Cytophagales bacterium]HAA21755.1 hypothetical protein [Cytophagales bacterium]HAP60046.1 hypothetical protein [Cytophagales bacterium]
MSSLTSISRPFPCAIDKILTTQLRNLEEEGFVHREGYPVVSPKVEYSMTGKGKTCIPIIETIRNYGIFLMEDAGISEE